MNLGELKEHIKSFPKKAEFEYSLSKPFSWRGSYDEVCFDISKTPSTREELLENIEEAFSGTFRGYKGGEYTYYDETPVNFESDYGSYSDGGYVRGLIQEINPLCQKSKNWSH
jgi:hypothetical protein